MGVITSRNYISGDEVGIVDLYNSITGHSRTYEQHLWEWIDSPYGIGNILILEDAESKEIVGHHGYIPLSLVDNGKEFMAGKTENTILHERYLGTGIYFIHEKKFFSQVVKKYRLIFTTSGHGTPGKIRKKLGYKALAQYETFLKITNPKSFYRLFDHYVFKRKRHVLLVILLKILGIFLSLFDPIVRLSYQKSTQGIQIQKEVWSERLGRSLDVFWDKNKSQFGVTVERTSAFLNWRIFQNPNIKYNFFSSYQDDILVGYIITRQAESGFPAGVIVDVIAKENNPHIIDALVKQAILDFEERNISYITFKALKVNGILNQAFSRLGFFNADKFWSILNKKSTQSELLVYTHANDLEGSLSEPDDWYYSELFCEGFI